MMARIEAPVSFSPRMMRASTMLISGVTEAKKIALAMLVSFSA